MIARFITRIREMLDGKQTLNDFFFIDHLTDDIVKEIIQKLDIKELLHLAIANKRFNRLIDNDLIFNKLVQSNQNEETLINWAKKNPRLREILSEREIPHQKEVKERLNIVNVDIGEICFKTLPCQHYITLKLDNGTFVNKDLMVAPVIKRKYSAFFNPETQAHFADAEKIDTMLRRMFQ